jgi:hypothetical protein
MQKYIHGIEKIKYISNISKLMFYRKVTKRGVYVLRHRMPCAHQCAQRGGFRGLAPG